MPAPPQTSAPAVEGAASAPRRATTPPASPAPPRASAPAGEAEATPLGIEQLAKDPAAFAGRQLMVRGVVAAVAPARRFFTMIPQSEYDACREVTCSSFEVPVSWDGPPPRSAQSVLVTGRLSQPEPGRFVFEAASVEVRQ